MTTARRHGLKSVSSRRSDTLSQTSWEDVETLLAAHYRQDGYRVDHVGTTGTGSRFDGGIDLKLYRDDAYIVVQCKHWNAYKVPHNEVHQLLGIMVNEGATGAILVTSGEFTRAAIEAASRQGHVQLIDGDDLRAMLGPLPAVEASPTIEARLAAAAMGGNLATNAAERLVAAAEDRIRHGGTQRGRSVVASSASAALVVVLVRCALALGLLYFGSMYIQRTIRNLAPGGPVAGQAQAVPPQSTHASAMTIPAHVDASARQRESQPPPVIHEKSPRDMVEWKRRNAESMEILRESTPEVLLAPRG